jgi:hypothetical protein
MNKNRYIYERGFIALLATSLTSLILMSGATSLLLTGWYVGFASVEREAKSASRVLAFGCVRHIESLLLSNETYQGNHILESDNGRCIITSINRSNDAPAGVSTTVTASVRESRTTLLVTFSYSDLWLQSSPSYIGRIGNESPQIQIEHIREVP